MKINASLKQINYSYSYAFMYYVIQVLDVIKHEIMNEIHYTLFFGKRLTFLKREISITFFVTVDVVFQNFAKNFYNFLNNYL